MEETTRLNIDGLPAELARLKAEAIRRGVEAEREREEAERKRRDATEQALNSRLTTLRRAIADSVPEEMQPFLDFSDLVTQVRKDDTQATPVFDLPGHRAIAARFVRRGEANDWARSDFGNGIGWKVFHGGGNTRGFADLGEALVDADEKLTDDEIPF